MNERIQELFEQAANKKYPAGVASIHSNQLDRFAELIVRECCFTGEQYAEGLIDLKHYAFVNKKIKEHFGVEE